jgi:hypothetical protein
MRLGSLRYALVALVFSLPLSALAAVTVTATVTPATTPVPAGSSVPVSCYAEAPASGMLGSTSIDRIDVTVSNGTATPSQLTGSTVTTCLSGTGSCSVLQGAVAWATPAVAGSLTVTCTAVYTTSSFVGSNTYTQASAPATLTTVAAALAAPVIDAFNGPAQLVVGTGNASLSVTAHDPNSPPAALTYAWTATGGTVTQDSSNPAAATWAPPAQPGPYTVSVTVSNGATSTVAAANIALVLAAYQAQLAVPLQAPRRLAVGSQGDMYAIDAATGALHLVTARGETKGVVNVTDGALAVAKGPGVVYVTTKTGRILKMDPSTGRYLGEVLLQGGRFARPLGIAWEPTRALIWVADADAGLVRLVRPDGTTARVIAAGGQSPLTGALDVAVDPVNGRAYVLRAEAKAPSELLATDPPELAKLVHAYDLDGNYTGSLVSVGSGTGLVARAAGATVDLTGRLLVTDIFQGTIQVFDKTGLASGSVGVWGPNPGQLESPMGLAVMANGDVAVANTNLGRIDRFGSGAPLPTCVVNGKPDSDCDGMDDAWELAHGLNPFDPRDALSDADGDGLVALEEYRHGTDPNKWDTDGDGFSDRDEILAGFDPLNPLDHKAVLSATAPAQTVPGLVRVSGVAAGPGTCGASWRQTGGPTVTLRDAATASPSFVARAAGTYVLEGTAVCTISATGKAASAPVKVSVAVQNVAPRADAGRTAVVALGNRADLSGAGSTDANGDALTYGWSQVAGPAALVRPSAAAAAVRAIAPGYSAYRVTARDAAGLTGQADVPVIVVGGDLAVPTAAAVETVVSGQVGAPVTLGAVSNGGTAFSWEQVEGPPAAGFDQASATPSFTPTVAGRYLFMLTAWNGALRSAPEAVQVYVAPAGAALPVAAATAPATVAVNSPVSLDGSASAASAGGALTYAWKQLSGPAAGLTEADRATATVVPFAPGYYELELTVSEGGVPGLPVRVAFQALVNARPLPVAVAWAQASALVGELVRLDGRGSVGARSFRWTQVAGPWAPLKSGESVPAFVPPAPGQYVFELEVSDGTAWSRPVTVSVLALPEVK